MLGFAVNSVVWTLALEAMFYVALPFIAAWYNRRPFLGLAIALATAVLWRVGATHATASLGWAGAGSWDAQTLTRVQIALTAQFPSYVGHFAAGMTGAWIFVRWRESVRGSTRAAVPVVQAATLAVMLFVIHAAGAKGLTGRATLIDHMTRTGIVGLLFAVLILATALAPAWAQWPISNRVCRRLGDVSYGVYLFHLPLIGLATTSLAFAVNGSDRALVGLLAFVLPTALLVGSLSYAGIEQPCRRWAASINRRRREASQAPGAVLEEAPTHR
jgi:peptidoglycan/LPS O-acetylase OafA/YrhL